MPIDLPRARPYALHRDQGPVCNYGIAFTIKASEIARSSGVAVVEYLTRRGEEPPDHTHPTEDEMFQVLEGDITFRCDGKSFDLTTGGLVFLPRGIEHGYTIRSEGAVRLLVITAPVREGVEGGWGGFVADMEERA